jgi:type II secretory pathway pseudopilin PulG
MCSCDDKTREAGFSIIEVLIATAVMMTVLASVMGLLGRSLSTSNSTYELTEAQESLRTAQEYISRDLTTVGDGLKCIGGIQIPAAFIATYLTIDPGIDPTNFPIVASDDSMPNGSVIQLANPAATILGGTDRITLLGIDPDFGSSIPLPAGAISANGTVINVGLADVARVNPGEIYCVTSRLGAAFGIITASAGAPNPSLTFTPGGLDIFGLNQVNGPIRAISHDPQTGNAIATTLARIRIMQYFVNMNGLLIRRVYGVRGAAFIDNVVAEHVTNMKIRYSLNLPDANGFARQPVSQLTNTLEQSSVRQVEVSLTTETAHGINNGARWPLTMTTSTSVRNLQFRQALQPTRAG